jgi:hypothetical protein
MSYNIHEKQKKGSKMKLPFMFCIAFIKGVAIDRLVCSTDAQWELLARTGMVCLSLLCFSGAAALVYILARKNENTD